MQTAKNLIDWAQADLSLCWVHTHFVGFDMSWLKSYQLFFFAVYEPDFQATEVQNGLQEAQPGYMTTGNVQVKLFTCWLAICMQ